jgi:hypothetical protein
LTAAAAAAIGAIRRPVVLLGVVPAVVAATNARISMDQPVDSNLQHNTRKKKKT